MRRIAFLACSVAALTLACRDGSPGPSTVVSGTANVPPNLTAAVSPTPPLLLTPRPAPETGVSGIDQLVRATLSGDIDEIMALIHYDRVGCVLPQQLGSAPGCHTDELPGTIVDSFPIVGCDGTNERPAEARRAIESTVRAGPVELYSAFRSSSPDADYRVVFEYGDSSGRRGFSFTVQDGRVTGLYLTCATVVDATRNVDEFLVAPPPGPHGQAPWHLNEGTIAGFVPTPYNTFVVSGTFDSLIDDVGDADPFAWSVPGALIYSGQTSSWRVYWHGAEVFDCAQSCTVGLAQAETSERLRALYPGDPICIIGWTDDVGNVAAELVYLHAPERCLPPSDFFDRPSSSSR